ncbi:MAG: phosphoribosylaminoimidazolesuccinocarboxamide synthase [Planctomycetota bacterium]
MPPPYTTAPVAGRAPWRSGKVRDLYDFGAEILLVASDRLSAFDVVFREPVPGKGIVLTAVSDFWLTKTRGIIANHRITSDVAQMDILTGGDRERLRGRAMYCKKSKPLAFEWVVRGYLSGSGWNDYKKTGEICGISLPKGLRESDRLPEPILTPTTKEEAGHDRSVTFAEVESALGTERARRARDRAIAIYQFASAIAAERGILLADTKFEFGELNGELLLIDEVLTPDSSRFWPANVYKPGGPQPSFDKQFVRDYLLTTGWSKTPPPPPLPADIITKTAEKYAEICYLLTGSRPF